MGTRCPHWVETRQKLELRRLTAAQLVAVIFTMLVVFYRAPEMLVELLGDLWAGS